MYTALLVLTISSAPSAFLTSQVQPEPKLPTALAVNFSLNASNEPKVAARCFAGAAGTGLVVGAEQLSPADQVVVRGNETLREGQPVQVAAQGG